MRVLVTATADQALKCRGVRCRAFWETSGRGDPDGATAFEASGPGAEIHPGMPLSAAFAFRIPVEGPVTYHGELVNIDWGVRVWLDLAWERDPEKAVQLNVVPRSE